MIKQKKLVKLIRIPQVLDDCFLFFAQNPDQIPFVIKRIYFITNPDTKLPRGYHAHKKTRQVFFCVQGSIKLVLDDGKKKQKITLNNPRVGVELPALVWHEMHEFKKNTILLILASEVFDPKDYIRDYHDFIKATTRKK